MNETIIYCPYKSQTWALIFTIPIGLLAFVGAGYCLSLSGISAISFVGIGIICIWLTKMIYDSSNKAVFFEQKGLRIVGGNYKDYRYILWEELTYAYFARDFKGHLFLVLSPNALNSKEAKRFANRGANLSQICVDSVVVIYMDVVQNVSQLKELIDNYVENVDIC